MRPSAMWSGRRCGRGAVTTVSNRSTGGGLIGAAFRHRTSRAGDPQLHTHVVVANTTRCEDGVWRALDGRHLYAHARTAGFLYQAELRHGAHPVARAASGSTRSARVSARSSGVAAEVLREFSRRRIQIEAADGRDGATIRSGPRRRLAVTTRTAKDYDVDAEQSWRPIGAQRAGLHGLDAATGADVVAPSTRCLYQRLHGCLHRRRHGRHGDATTSWRARAHGVEDAHVRSARRAAHVGRARARRRDESPPRSPAPIVFLASGQVEAVGVALTGVQYSTVELLAIERHLLDQARSPPSRRQLGVCDATATRPPELPLSVEQAAMVTTLTSDGAGVSVVVGAAGTGKTHALAVAREAWEQHGYTVDRLRARRPAPRTSSKPGAGSRRSASTGSSPHSTGARLGGLSRTRSWSSTKPRWSAPANSPASCDHAARADAKVVLVGDHHQLPAIEAGGVFAALAQRLGAIHLTEQPTPTATRSNATRSPNSEPVTPPGRSTSSTTATGSAVTATATAPMPRWSRTGSPAPSTAKT